jgi:hypothetical protein
MRPDEREASGEPLEAEGVPDLEGPLPEKEATGDPQEGVAPPNYFPKAATDWGTTAEEQRRLEPLDVRLQREQPDLGQSDALPGDDEWRQPVRLIDEGDEDVGLEDDEKDLVATAAEDDEPDDFSAEEAALHIETEP